jgi:hypothetical protein
MSDSIPYLAYTGTLVVDGLMAGVGAEGIVRNERKDSRYPNVRKLPMRDRLTVLCKLGMGASSAVYKALDLTDMRLVALKMIRVNERYNCLCYMPIYAYLT